MKICAYVTSLCVNTLYTNMWHVLENTLSKMFEIVIIKLNSFEKTFWWSCKYKSRSKKLTCPFGLVPMKFLLSDGRITCPGLRASGLRRRLLKETWKCGLYEQLPFTYGLKLYAPFINGKMGRLAFRQWFVI